MKLTRKLLNAVKFEEIITDIKFRDDDD